MLAGFGSWVNIWNKKNAYQEELLQFKERSNAEARRVRVIEDRINLFALDFTNSVEPLLAEIALSKEQALQNLVAVSDAFKELIIAGNELCESLTDTSA